MGSAFLYSFLIGLVKINYLRDLRERPQKPTDTTETKRKEEGESSERCRECRRLLDDPDLKMFTGDSNDAVSH